jgi:hypothetical protein
MPFEPGRDISVLAVGDVATEASILRREKEIHCRLGKLQSSVRPECPRLVEARPVQLVAKVVTVAQPLNIADQLRRIDELQDADAEEPVTRVYNARLVEKDRGGRVVLRETTDDDWDSACRHASHGSVALQLWNVSIPAMPILVPTSMS